MQHAMQRITHLRLRPASCRRAAALRQPDVTNCYLDRPATVPQRVDAQREDLGELPQPAALLPCQHCIHMAQSEALVAQHGRQRVAEHFCARCGCLLGEVLQRVAPAAVGSCQLAELLLRCEIPKNRQVAVAGRWQLENLKHMQVWRGPHMWHAAGGRTTTRPKSQQQVGGGGAVDQLSETAVSRGVWRQLQQLLLLVPSLQLLVLVE